MKLRQIVRQIIKEELDDSKYDSIQDVKIPCLSIEQIERDSEEIRRWDSPPSIFQTILDDAKERGIKGKCAIITRAKLELSDDKSHVVLKILGMPFYVNNREYDSDKFFNYGTVEAADIEDGDKYELVKNKIGSHCWMLKGTKALVERANKQFKRMN